MMHRSAAIAIVLCMFLVLSARASADIALPGGPRYANKIMDGFVTPTVAPGETVGFAFNISNPYDDPSANMSNVVLTMGIYKYATQEEVRDVDTSFSAPPLINGTTTEAEILLGTIAFGGTERVELDIETRESTPHGSYFSQSTYFVRFSLAFYFEGNSTQVVLKSRGYFSDEQWNTMVSFEDDQDIVNTTYMKSLGVDGLLPDSSFGIKIPIPRWPLGVIIGACGLVSFMALYYFVLDNPGKYPKLEKRFYYLRGKLSQLRSKLQDRAGK